MLQVLLKGTPEQKQDVCLEIELIRAQLLEEAREEGSKAEAHMNKAAKLHRDAEMLRALHMAIIGAEIPY